MESGHFHHGEITADIRIEDEEGSGVATENLVSEVIYTSCCTQWGIFL